MAAIAPAAARRIEAKIEKDDPGDTIGSCKDLVESVIAQILDARGVPVSSRDDLGKKFKKVVDALRLRTNAVPGDPKASEAVTGVIRGLDQTMQNLGALRNAAGTGHGRASTSPVTRRHARLALNAAVTVTEYLFAEWEKINP
ncbi:abortive infection family protein [Rhodococcus spongiicola]|uniref:Abortive infection protein-like C-terminal domain-containing protein n=1 Tax=Rhodococcus spongiicola TaxID=2487352 RepID=A0A3S3BLX9_9NOCA|nr:abortive infection family protein [Rhodococcus spongiicola]RVW04434.1 hypothetical protein EF834_04950 [Rhodococcus spongiicola]